MLKLRNCPMLLAACTSIIIGAAGNVSAAQLPAGPLQTPAEPSTFRGLYVGMSSADFVRVAKATHINYELLLAFRVSQDSNSASVINMQLSVGNGVVVNTDLTDNCKGELPSSQCFPLYSASEALTEKHPQEIHMDNLKGYTGYIDKYISFSFDNSSEVPDFRVIGLAFQPEFFEAQGMPIDDFAKALVSKYEFVDRTLYYGQDKGFGGNCYVGLTSAGELVQVCGEQYSWAIQVDIASDEIKSRFVQITPKF